MNDIILPARFEMFDDNSHGWIIYSDRRRSKSSRTMLEAFIQVDYLFEKGELLEIEAIELLKQIADSDLPPFPYDEMNMALISHSRFVHSLN
ncbi:MAG: hypothetical protein COX02_01395 [Candidatus Vogelbacteria bacterium CG22_combo_CG10-13_8_21_14_all_37_9]|uniref:Uncharacterized protein n=1 Tax=Candidatus Vogelbacteria bacterium CG22_combo_CG10-13_8_21_14_all_37_9 TaxID=1975046 RepID=A0A2H0BL25_9BACT|nr:MAG: hypothetical protein BK005_01565 [bacterium CG10_37_50]PIP58249.1 MAG: hypothetical protein COX02_01395 [Candidatus Vogelbacteria bacterium CG22_combo_CG10-13_8_21_14_all_37_9]